MGSKKIVLIASLVLIALLILFLVLSINSTRKTINAKKKYLEATAYVDDFKERIFYKDDKYGNKVKKNSYFDYTFYFTVGDKTYTGKQNNVSIVPFKLLNGEDGVEENEKLIFAKFSVYYNPENPDEYVIDEINYPYALYIFTGILFVLSIVGLYRVKIEYSKSNI